MKKHTRPRTLEAPIREDLTRKMVFIAGPRQVGKTTLARSILATERSGAYFSWDRREDRRIVLSGALPPPPSLVVLDEFHKYRSWKRWLKGEWDAHGGEYRFLVTGSARLDVYRRGGDSLQGRYHHYRLHPFTAGEASGRLVAPAPSAPLALDRAVSKDLVGDLLRYGGFPEPLFAGNARAHRRWRKERLDRFFREDVRDLETVRDLSSMELLADLLPSRVGSPLSLDSIRGDLDVSHRAVSRWMQILERLYFAHRVPPFETTRVRALKKQPKAYLWDWSLVPEPGARFENLIAAHLLRLCHYLEDVDGFAVSLHYLRDASKREVDFLVTFDRKPWFAVEARLGGSDVSPHLRYFGSRLRIPHLYQVVLEGRDFVHEGVRVVPAAKFLAALP